MNRKKIIPMSAENTRVSEGMKQSPMTVESTIVMPTCPKCKKVPLKCPYPNSCGMEDL